MPDDACPLPHSSPCSRDCSRPPPPRPTPSSPRAGRRRRRPPRPRPSPPPARSTGTSAPPQCTQAALGPTATIGSVRLQWEAAYAPAFRIQVSPDANAWTDVYSTTTSTGGTQTLTVSGPGRYVRVLGTARATVWGYSLFELQVFGTTGTNPNPQ